jgi:hypothetical protein
MIVFVSMGIASGNLAAALRWFIGLFNVCGIFRGCGIFCFGFVVLKNNLELA